MKRNINGDGHLRQRSNGLWQLDIQIDGKKHSYYGHTEQEALEKARLASEEAQKTVKKLTLNEWFDIWIQTFVQTKASTRKKYERDYRLYVRPFIGDMPIDEIGTIDIQKIYIKNMTNGLSPKSIYNVHGVLSSMFKKALKLNHVRKNVVADCELPKLRKPQMYPLMDNDTATFLKAARGDRFFDQFFVAVFTGMRQSQIIGLTWDCIDFQKRTIRIYRQLVKVGSQNRKGVFQFTPLKNGKQRTIIVPSQVIEVFDRLKRKNSKSTVQPQFNCVFVNPDGSHIQYHTLYTHFKNIVRSIDRPMVRFHDLRHTYATLAIQNGSDIKTVSTNLGHATVAFTMDRYGHVSKEMQENAASRMQLMIANCGTTAVQEENKKLEAQ